MAHKLSRDDVAHVAYLARLEVPDADIDVYTDQLASVLNYATEMDQLDIEGLAPTSHPLPLENVLREDEVRPTLDREEVLACAPQAIDGRFGVPRILNEEA